MLDPQQSEGTNAKTCTCMHILYSVNDMKLESCQPSQHTVMISGLAAQKFGVASLHSWQLNVIKGTLERKDSLVVQPTGAGKSACFIIPPLCDSKTAIVITPTVSLMLDQVAKLTKKNIPSTLLGSAQPNNVSGSIQNGDFRLVYTTPESFYDQVKKEPKKNVYRNVKGG